MADKTNTPIVESDSIHETPTRAKRDGKSVAAFFTPKEYADLREVRFVARLDKDSDVVKAAVREFAEKHLTASE